MTAAGIVDGAALKRPPRDLDSGASVGSALRGHLNSLGIIRLVLASLVIVDHAFPLGGFGEDPFWRYTNGQTSLGGIAVGGFFVISGYLIVKSGASSDLMQFLWRRVIRIFPAFWGVLLFTAFVVGPIAWLVRGEPLSTYFTLGPGGPFSYITSNWTSSSAPHTGSSPAGASSTARSGRSPTSGVATCWSLCSPCLVFSPVPGSSCRSSLGLCCSPRR